MCAGNGPLLRVWAIIIAGRYSYAAIGYACADKIVGVGQPIL
jgi:hypothetical protein